jgi:hypothetical protein
VWLLRWVAEQFTLNSTLLLPLLLLLLLLLLRLAAAVLYTLLALDIDPVERLLQLLPMSEVRAAAENYLLHISSEKCRSLRTLALSRQLDLAYTSSAPKTDGLPHSTCRLLQRN